MNDVLATLKSLMNAKGLSENQLAHLSHVSQSTLNSLFRKNNTPTIFTLQELCKGLDISMSEFFKLVQYHQEDPLPTNPDVHSDLGIFEQEHVAPQFQGLSIQTKFDRLKDKEQSIVETLVDYLLSHE